MMRVCILHLSMDTFFTGSGEVMLLGDLHLQIWTQQITAGDGGLLVYSSEGQGTVALI
jgi:hypothetical protein